MYFSAPPVYARLFFLWNLPVLSADGMIFYPQAVAVLVRTLITADASHINPTETADAERDDLGYDADQCDSPPPAKTDANTALISSSRIAVLKDGA